MSEKIPKATHIGELKIAKFTIRCAVLEDGTRVLSRIGVLRAIGRTGKAKGGRAYDRESKLPVFLTAKNLNPFLSNELIRNSTPILFKPRKGGTHSIGYRAELLPLICSVFLDADEAGVILSSQKHIVERSKILLRGFAVVGINALIDEATGYQEVRDRLALQKILERWIAKELLPWTKRFPDEFYRQMFRLKGWQYSPLSVKRPKVIGHYTDDIVYSRLETGVLEELKKKNPTTEKGYRKNKHHQWLTPDIGHPKLRDHLNAVLALMRASPTWDMFKRLLNRAFPKKGQTLQLLLDEKNEM